MLLRVFRVSDRLGLVLLKISTGFGLLLLESVGGVTSATNNLGRHIRAVLVVILSAGLAVLAFVGGILQQILNVIFNLAIRLVGRITVSARTSTSNAMARRSARAEMQSTVVEDPLRTQNRVLNGLVTVALFVLIAVILWATRDNDTAPTSPPSINLNVAPAASPQSSTEVALLPTSVPTATELPDVLQVRGSLAYVVREQGQTDIWVAPVDSRTQLRLTNDPADERDPAWSPDGSKLAYASNKDGNWEIYIYDLNTEQETRMTFSLVFEAAPTWSPDGEFLIYESYQDETHLDIFAMKADGSEIPFAIAISPAPDFSPAWDPSNDGRRIAFVSWQEGNQDIYLFNLDSQTTTNLTNTPNRHEDFPAWSPNGERLAYSAVETGIETIFVLNPTNPGQPEVFGRGRTPAWSPDGTSIVAAIDSADDTRMVVSPYVDTGVTTQVIQAPKGSSSPAWTSVPLPTTLVNSGGLELSVSEPLYIEQVPQDEPPYGLGSIPNIPGIDLAVLNDRVDDSFNALRETTNSQVGWDFLATLSDTWWELDHRPQPGEPRRNWHLTGRAFAFNRNQILGFPPPIEVMREDGELETSWRVYVRVTDEAQNGELGEPLRHMPWIFARPEQGDVEAYEQGGRLRGEMPDGYYVDFTQLAEDYGWFATPAGNGWRSNTNVRNYWMYQKRDGLTWYEAMLELYTESQLGGFVPTPPPEQG